ncbi:MAG TPA: hypothetical protein DDW55_09800 [Gammaproteobacteria bacterium]|nr:hypothetical protein [Gammaproteobacteria bacterium]
MDKDLTETFLELPTGADPEEPTDPAAHFTFAFTKSERDQLGYAVARYPKDAVAVFLDGLEGMVELHRSYNTAPLCRTDIKARKDAAEQLREAAKAITGAYALVSDVDIFGLDRGFDRRRLLQIADVIEGSAGAGASRGPDRTHAHILIAGAGEEYQDAFAERPSPRDESCFFGVVNILFKILTAHDFTDLPPVSARTLRNSLVPKCS